MLPSLAGNAARFSAADDPWIPVRRATTYAHVGLRELFLEAHTYDDLAIAMAPAASGLLRFGAAIIARITGLDNVGLTADQWNQHRRQAFAHGRFAPDAVNAYFDNDEYCFDVFDPDRPFLQEPLLAEQCPYPSGINKLVWGRPAGRNLAWLNPHHDLDPVPLPTPQALLHLLTHHYYGASGTYTPRAAPGRPASLHGSSGPLRATVSFHPLGRTLFETLLAQIPKFTGYPTPPVPDTEETGDRCPWESAWRPGPHEARPEVTWPGRLLTGRSRHALLLVPAPGGTHVTDVYLTWGDQVKPLPATDPYLVMDTVTGGRRADRRRMPRRADADRAWWRELEALLLAPDEEHSFRRPEIFDTLNDLPPQVRTHLRVRVHGFDQDGQTRDHRWYTAITPPLLAWAQENDPQRAERIGACVKAAHAMAADLKDVAEQAWKDTINGPAAGAVGAMAGRETGKKKPVRRTAPKDTSPASAKKTAGRSPWTAPAGTEYWRGAEKTFWRLLDAPDAWPHAAFAATAEAALRQVTALDRVRYRHAARAVATAVADLHQRARSRRQPDQEG
ncbi:type I-E CRISPR-associated protein Cse1/CasA [Streptomyces sp. NPDC051976]|uniref:type I-E CRISPR-associated protein Cse1/CasA n=1 Tax=Streptomyces sp. NPDC051976 TaxID=3154947 RepID=UPI0034470FA6